MENIEKESLLLTPQDEKQMYRIETIVILENYSQNRKEFIDVLTTFQSIWNGHLGRISTMKNRVDLLSPMIRPINSVPYRAKPKTRNLEKSQLKTC